MGEVTQAKSCQNYSPIMRDLFILKDTEDYLSQTPDGVVKDALAGRRPRTYPAAKLLGVRGYRDRQNLGTLSGLKRALDKKISAHNGTDAYNKHAEYLNVPRDRTDLLAALNDLHKNPPTDAKLAKIFQARLIVEDLEQYLKAQDPDADADKQLKNLSRTKRVLARKIRRDRKLRAMYQELTRDLLFDKSSNLDLRTLLCRPDPCESYCPTISSATLEQFQPGQESTLTVNGKNLPKNPKIEISDPKIQVLKVEYSPTQLKIKIKVLPGAGTGQKTISVSSWGNLLAAKSTFDIHDPCAKITNNLLRAGCCENNPAATSCKKGGE